MAMSIQDSSLEEETCPPPAPKPTFRSLRRSLPEAHTSSKQLFPLTSTLTKPGFLSPSSPTTQGKFICPSPSPSPILARGSLLTSPVMLNFEASSPSPTLHRARISLPADFKRRSRLNLSQEEQDGRLQLKRKSRILFDQQDKEEKDKAEISMQNEEEKEEKPEAVPCFEGQPNPYLAVPSPPAPHHHSPDSKHCSLEECSLEEQTSKRAKLERELPRYLQEFQEVRVAGRGEHSTVHLARHRLDGVEYAVKVSSKGRLAKGHDRQRLQAEVWGLAAVVGEGLVRYHSSWLEEGRLYIQTEWCSGGSLEDLVARLRREGSRMEEQELATLARQVTSGLARLHRAGLAHLDVKPENILLQKGEGGELSFKLGDLGNVARLGCEDAKVEDGDCRFLAPDLLAMAPDTTLLHKADTFSLGLTLYAVASLEQMPRNSEEGEGYERHMRGELPYLEHYSPQFNCLLAACVRPVVGERPTCQQLLSMDWLASQQERTKNTIMSQLEESRNENERLKMELSILKGEMHRD